MLKLKKESKRLPFGGHHYTENGVTFKGESFKEVVKKLQDFRVTNSIPVGFPEQEVLQFYAKHWPWLVTEDREAKVEREPNPVYIGWRDWIFKVWKSPPPKFITRKEALERAKICETCPYNIPISYVVGAECDELKKKSIILSRGITISDSIGYCRLHGADLSVFVLADPPSALSSKQSKETHQGCWAE